MRRSVRWWVLRIIRRKEESANVIRLASTTTPPWTAAIVSISAPSEVVLSMSNSPCGEITGSGEGLEPSGSGIVTG